MKVFWFDRQKVIGKLQNALRDVKDRYPEVERVILFGSLGRGDAVPGSDADVLLVLEESDLPFEERSVRYLPTDAGIGVDVFPYTRRELDAMVESGNAFVARALKEGMDLVPTCGNSRNLFW